MSKRQLVIRDCAESIRDAAEEVCECSTLRNRCLLVSACLHFALREFNIRSYVVQGEWLRPKTKPVGVFGRLIVGFPRDPHAWVRIPRFGNVDLTATQFSKHLPRVLTFAESPKHHVLFEKSDEVSLQNHVFEMAALDIAIQIQQRAYENLLTKYPAMLQRERPETRSKIEMNRSEEAPMPELIHVGAPVQSSAEQGFRARSSGSNLRHCHHCGCEASLVGGQEIYPHRPDLFHKQFYLCQCGAYVGTHPGTTNPLGHPANAELRKAKAMAHAVFDPMWKRGNMGRNAAYRWLAEQLGIAPSQTHIGWFDLETCQRVIAICTERPIDATQDEKGGVARVEGARSSGGGA